MYSGVTAVTFESSVTVSHFLADFTQILVVGTMQVTEEFELRVVL